MLFIYFFLKSSYFLNYKWSLFLPDLSDSTSLVYENILMMPKLTESHRLKLLPG